MRYMYTTIPLFFILFIFVLPSTSESKKISKTIDSCCIGGKLFDHVSKKQCSRRKGIYYTKQPREKATKECKNETSSLSTKKPESTPPDRVTGFCCVKGKLSPRMTEKKCEKLQGKFYTGQQAEKAGRFCRVEKGYCSAQGLIFATDKEKCARKHGQFSSRKTVWCYAHGNIELLEAGVCSKRKGKQFTRKLDARRFALSNKRKQDLHKKKSLTDMNSSLSHSGELPVNVNSRNVGISPASSILFPARIKSISSDTLHFGETFTIVGENFGFRRGEVVLGLQGMRTVRGNNHTMRLSGRRHSAYVLTWTDSVIRAKIPLSLKALNRDGVVSVNVWPPARSHNNSSTLQYGGDSRADRGYDYNGEEGPSYSPVTIIGYRPPEVTSPSSVEVFEGGKIEITGRNLNRPSFSKGVLSLFQDKRVCNIFSVLDWGETIMIKVSDSALQGFCPDGQPLDSARFLLYLRWQRDERFGARRGFHSMTVTVRRRNEYKNCFQENIPFCKRRKNRRPQKKHHRKRGHNPHTGNGRRPR